MARSKRKNRRDRYFFELRINYGSVRSMWLDVTTSSKNRRFWRRHSSKRRRLADKYAIAQSIKGI